MKKNTALVTVLLIVIIALIAWFAFRSTTGSPSTVETADNSGVSQTSSILTYDDCVRAGYPVTTGTPSRCTTPDGKVYAQEIKQNFVYQNASSGLIMIDTPYPGAVTGKQFSITGKARGTWYFEASFPYQILDSTGKVLTQGQGRAQGNWMTTDFVPFKADVSIPNSYTGKATVVVKKDNPSGMPEKDASVSFPITIEY